jgi:hypothetical protein
MFDIKIGEKEVKKSISGKDLKLDNNREIVFLRDLDENETFTGNPIVSIFENDEKTYNNASIRLIGDDEELRLSVNFPKKDYPLVKNLNHNFGFYLNAFNLVKDIAILTGVEGVDDMTGAFKQVNFKEVLEFVDGLEEMEIMAYYPEDSEYMSFRVVKTL